MRCHREKLPTFLDHEEVPSDNNGGKRGIRPAVLIRKNSYGNGSKKRVQTKAVLMIIMRGHNAMQILMDALKSMSAQDTSRLYRQKARQLN